jgi:hypothetical protein
MAKLKRIFQKTSVFLKKPATKKVLKTSLIILLMGVVLFFGIRYYLSLRERTGNPWDFVPENVLTVIQVNDVREFVSATTGNQVYSDFSNLLMFTEVRNTFIFFDSLFATREQVQSSWQQGQLLISTHYTGSDKYEILFLKPLPHPNDRTRILQFFEKHATATNEVELQGQKDKINRYRFGSKDYFMSIRDGVCLFSKSTTVIQNALKTYRSKSTILTDTAFTEVQASSGKTCMANCYINYAFAHRFISKYLNGENLNTLDFLNNFAGWTSIDLHTGDHKVFGTGFTSVAGMSNTLLGVFTNSEPQPTDIISYLPYHTISFIWTGFSDYETHREAYKLYLGEGVREFNNNLTNLKRRTNVQNINELVFPHIDNQMATFTTPAKAGRKSHSYAIFKVRDVPVFRKNMRDITRSADKANNTRTDTSSFRNITITTIQADYMLFDLFGKQFSNVEKTCYAIYDSYWIVGSSHEAMKEYLNQVMSGRTLVKNPSYEEFSQSVSGEANIYIYSSPRRMKQEISTWFNETYSETVSDRISELDQTDGFGIQFSGQNSLFLTGVTIFRSQHISDEVSSGWEISLDGQQASGPWFVEVAEQSSPNIIIFDAFNNMYFVSDKGEILWKTPVAERPVSKVFTVDAFKNGKRQYLFSSENYIYLIDRNGKNLENFPMKLPVQAAGPVNVFDYDKTREYRLVFTGTDNVIYNYTIQGEPTTGWEKPNLKTDASQTVEHIRLINTDALIVKDNQNRLHFFNRRGVPMFELPNLTTGQYSEVFAAPKLCRCFVTTTADGQIARIGTNGELEYKIIHEAGPGHVFMFEDMDRDGQADYIFIEKGKAFIFSGDGNLISGPEISPDAGRNAGFVRDSPYGPLLYVFSSDGSEIYFINKTGKILPEETFFSSGSADHFLSVDNSRLLITSAKGNSLYLYVIE